jgi:hypothetical protein
MVAMQLLDLTLSVTETWEQRNSAGHREYVDYARANILSWHDPCWFLVLCAY